ncbi:replication initiation factor domain-containing protein [Listeria monocytogenes]|nr:replication initiation factor domain-containing protein [Listeria monocytogenes]EKA2552878.1 replication initiation factor domain-containing protein [Listeria monocytogenes]EKA2556036.1 replication initiation factor domain-containing protein [Listeria monocytogenes]EKA2559160.1 replication initiation factor domain-containing protein [Listeria monocytogenes]EKA2562328.1 replication initiation factor domain-containing protein [Listeria monocytogenes]
MTKKQELTAMIDYLRVSFKTHDLDLIIEKVLHIKKEYMLEKETGRYGYIGTFELDMIKVYYSAPEDERGVLIELSGQGCRQFESFLACLKQSWFEFLQTCIDFQGNFTRLDVAIDDRKTYLNIPTLLNKAHKAECISKFNNYDFNGSGDLTSGLEKGTTLYLGSKKSEMYFCFYEKNYEQAKKNRVPVESIGKWNRYELRMNDDRAQEVVKNLLLTKDMTNVAKSIMHNYIRFIDIPTNLKGEARIKARRNAKLNKRWENFVEGVSKLKLYTEKQEDFYEKSKRWLDFAGSATMKMVLEADKELGTNELSDMIINAVLNLRQEHMLEVKLATVDDMVCDK